MKSSSEFIEFILFNNLKDTENKYSVDKFLTDTVSKLFSFSSKYVGFKSSSKNDSNLSSHSSSESDNL